MKELKYSNTMLSFYDFGLKWGYIMKKRIITGKESSENIEKKPRRNFFKEAFFSDDDDDEDEDDEDEDDEDGAGDEVPCGSEP